MQKTIQMPGDWLYQIDWKKTDIPSNGRTLLNAPVLIVLDKEGLGNELVSILSDYGYSCITISYGPGFKKNHPDSYIINPADPADYTALREHIREDKGLPGGIFFLANYKVPVPVDCNTIEPLLTEGLYAQFMLMREYFDDLKKESFLVCFVSANANAVLSGEQVLMPHAAMSEALLKGVYLECPGLNIRNIDFDYDVTRNRERAMIIYQECLVYEEPWLVAYRADKRYIPYVTPFPDKKAVAGSLIGKQDAVYLVTGGASGIGLEICRFLASQAKCHLIILGRRELPAKENWAVVVEKGKDMNVVTVSNLMDLEKNGSQVYYYALDVGNEAEMNNVFEQIRKVHTKVDGIVHSAGFFTLGTSLRSWKLSSFKKIFVPKVYGTLLLDYFSRGLSPEFMVLFSSLNTLLVPKFNFDYAAANSFMDAFADSRKHSGLKVLSINWPGWAETGMRARDTGKKGGGIKDLTTEEGMTIFSRMLAADTDKGNVIVIPMERHHFQNCPFFFVEGVL